MRIKCRSETREVQILEATDAQDGEKLKKRFNGVTVDEVSARSA